ncbi:MAG: hypothetical protein Q7J34_02295 [Bacteroidales bacterium]|jgi:hypothetical protein|nr:hypothetical protein [Bacteroidales bacterium]
MKSKLFLLTVTAAIISIYAVQRNMKTNIFDISDPEEGCASFVKYANENDDVLEDFLSSDKFAVTLQYFLLHAQVENAWLFWHKKQFG